MAGIVIQRPPPRSYPKKRQRPASSPVGVLIGGPGARVETHSPVLGLLDTFPHLFRPFLTNNDQLELSLTCRCLKAFR
jgi:hypothetical protein